MDILKDIISMLLSARTNSLQSWKYSIKSLPDNKFLDWSKLKQIADALEMHLSAFKMKTKCNIA